MTTIDTKGWGKYFLAFFNKSFGKYKGLTISYNVVLEGTTVVATSFINTHSMMSEERGLYNEKELKTIKDEYGVKKEIVGVLPFIPTIQESKGTISAIFYKVAQISKVENESLNLRDSWNGGKSYSKKWEENSKYAWCSYFFTH